MDEQDDWAPLPAELTGVHPGERVELAPRPPAPPEPAPAPGPSPEERTAREAAQEAALADLRRRLEATPPKATLVGEIARQQHRQLRRQRAAASDRLQACATVTSAVTAADIPLAIDYSAGADGRDPREEEAWYLALPAPERERLRAVWTQQRVQLVGTSRVQRRNQRDRALAALVVFAAAALLGMPGTWPITLAAGALCAIVWRHTGPCRYRDAMTALGCLLLAHLVAMLGGSNAMMFAFMDGVILVGLSALVGFHGEIRRTGGFDAR